MFHHQGLVKPGVLQPWQGVISLPAVGALLGQKVGHELKEVDAENNFLPLLVKKLNVCLFIHPNILKHNSFRNLLEQAKL